MVLEELIEYEEDESIITTLRVQINRYDDDELCNLFNELRENTTVEMVIIESDVLADGGYQPIALGAKPSLALGAAISQHPTVKDISFFRVHLISNFGAIAVSIQQNKGLVELGLYSCDLSPEQMAELEWLLAENGLQSLDIDACYPGYPAKQRSMHCARPSFEHKSQKVIS